MTVIIEVAYEKHDTWELPFSPFSSGQHFQIIGELGAKNYFTDYQIANTIQSFVSLKENLCNLFFLSASVSEGEFLRDYLRNLAPCSLAY